MAHSLPLRYRRARARGLSVRLARLWNGRVNMGIGNRATLTTALAGANNDLTLFAKTPGTAGNSLRLIITVAGVNTPLSVSVAGNDITVASATNGASAATSTAQDVVNAIRFSPTANPLVHAQVAAANDGTGVVTALAATNLTGAV